MRNAAPPSITTWDCPAYAQADIHAETYFPRSSSSQSPLQTAAAGGQEPAALGSALAAHGRGGVLDPHGCAKAANGVRGACPCLLNPLSGAPVLLSDTTLARPGAYHPPACHDRYIYTSFFSVAKARQPSSTDDLPTSDVRSEDWRAQMNLWTLQLQVGQQANKRHSMPWRFSQQ